MKKIDKFAFLPIKITLALFFLIGILVFLAVILDDSNCTNKIIGVLFCAILVSFPLGFFVGYKVHKIQE